MYETLLQLFGYGLCHQLPERSFFGGGVQVPVCARDTGIYIGFLISVTVISVVQRNRPTGLPPRVASILIGGFILAMAADGISSYAGLRDTSNFIRLVTGLMAGYAMGALALPLLNDQLWRNGSHDRVLGTGRALAAWLASLVIAVPALWWIAPLLGRVYPLLVVLSILGTLTFVNLILVCLLPSFERRADRLSEAWVQLLIAFALSWVEVILSALLKFGLVRITGG